MGRIAVVYLSFVSKTNGTIRGGYMRQQRRWRNRHESVAIANKKHSRNRVLRDNLSTTT
ncbi:hypothetical protein COO91_01999 [Nostoc flagelliforme CCNUN1]|uniref:Uncharacterized protein n=1 Tax=Nostoc flagelliforme CCNUN1 TaxID=2038116 RepID=A0A2K8SL68_9NOSO|nr:hypothetical protein [Nostoc flagelliforme]AUB36100.1 hypothetical protein COO91_01999 [Nostoc flagelliforme CCNUN1]